MTNSTLSKFITFVAGAVVGSAVTWKLVKTKYEKIAQQEIDSVIKEFNRMKEGIEPRIEEELAEEKDDPDERKVEYTNYKSLIRDSGYNYEEEFDEEEDKEMIEPYVIPPYEFDENGYETVTLYYYACGTLADQFDEIVNDIDELIGEDSLSHFGEYEKDSVHVRNDNLKTDYEILKDRRRFSEVRQ